MLQKRHSIFLRNKLKDYTGLFQYFEENSMRLVEYYEDIPDETLKAIFAGLHFQLNVLFESLNGRLNESRYRANESRGLLRIVRDLPTIQSVLKGTEFEFKVADEYANALQLCKEFLRDSGGSEIPVDFQPIEIIEAEPVFNLVMTIVVRRNKQRNSFSRTLIGGGSYANVYRYWDDYYHRNFAIKTAKNNASVEELERLKTEFQIMSGFKSPYVVEVYNLDGQNHEYVMEYVDTTLDKYITTNNNKLHLLERVNLVRQILRVFGYIHSTGAMHRDISTKNVLVKIYDEQKVIKVSDFGLVKLPESKLTKTDTDMKGHLNDPKLSIVGFKNYQMRHETFALTRLIYFVLTGRTSLEDYPNQALREFVEKGISDSIDDRYSDVKELQAAFDVLIMNLVEEDYTDSRQARKRRLELTER